MRPPSALNPSLWRGTARVAAALAAALMLSAPLPAQEASGDAPAGEAQAEDTPVIDSADRSVGAMVMEAPAEPEVAMPSDAGLAGGLPEVLTSDPALEGAGPTPSGGATAVMPFAGTAPAGVPMPGAADATGTGMAMLLPGPRTRTPVVVELFTSQGCSSCPPADALLDAMSGRPDVLPLSFHVDYWDYLGWADVFARPEFTARQRAYALRSGERAVWTPQIIVGGAETLLELTPVALQRLIDTHHAQAAPLSVGVARDGGRVTVDLMPAPGARAALVELVRYLPYREVAIRAGENRGRTVGYRNVVVGLQRLAVWDGRKPLRLTIRLGEGGTADLPGDTAHALLIQAQDGSRPGPILAALPLD